MSLNNLTIKKAQKLLADKEISAKELVSHYLKNIEEKTKISMPIWKCLMTLLKKPKNLTKRE